MAKKTPGIYIAIRGDVSAFEADLHRARQIAKEQGEAIAKSMGNAVSAADLTGGITKLTRELKTAQAALSAGAFKAQVSGLEDIAKAAGVSSKHLEGLTNSMLKSQAATTADRAFEYLQKNAGLSATALAKLRRELGDTEGALKTAMGALNARTRSAIVSEMKDIVAAYREVKNSADATANDVKRAAESMRGSLKKLASEARATKVAPTVELTPLQQALASVQRSGKLTTQEIDRLSAKAAQFAGKRDMEQALARIKSEAGLSAAEMAKLRFQMGDTGGALSTLMSGAKAAAVPVLAVGAAFATVAKASFDATLKLDSTSAAFESITGGAKTAQEQLRFIRELSDKLGLSFLDTAQSAKTIFASAESTGLGMEKAQKAFQAVATAGTALKLTTDQMNRLNLAVSQVISKGRPMAEEMRQQIGEVLPGAMGLFAKSIGVTGKELDKMFQDGKTTLEQFFTFLDALQDKYEEAAQNASHSLQAELGRLKTSWDDFFVAIGDSDGFASITRGLSAVLDKATNIIKESELPNTVANLFKNIDVDVSGPAKAAAQIEAEIANVVSAVQKMPHPMEAAKEASNQLEASIRSQTITLEYWLDNLPDEGFFKGIFGTINELTPATQAAFDEIQKLLEETKKTHDLQTFRDRLTAIGKSLEEEGEMTVRFRSYLEKLQETSSRAVVIQLQLEGKEKVLQGLREVWQAQRLQNDPALATQKQWKADFDALIAGHREATEKETRAATEAIEKLDKLYEKSAEGKKEKIRSEIEAIGKGRVALEQAVKDGIRSQKELDDYNQKAASATKKLKEDQRKINTAGSKSAEAAANRAATALAAYDAELAKLTKSSRDVEQVKIDEKLRKIAKDAKLPAEALEELRKAMEQEADFKWMQGILSYADPAAAAIAKVDREYQDFLRDVQSLKKEDPEKYTQLMAKAETEHEKALRKATRAGKEQNDHTQEKLAFYKELEELTGQYGLSLQYQNDLLAEQVELWRDADIPEEYINKMRELRELQMSRDWVDGAKRGLLEYGASASDTAKGVEGSFKGLFDGMDSGWRSAWQQMIETGKMSLSSFKSLFASFLADLLHMAITRPITVQLAGVVSGMFGAGGVANAAGVAGGPGGLNIGGLSNLSSLLPDSWASGVSGFLGTTLPGTSAALTAPGAYSAGEILLMQGGGTTAGTVGGQAALMSNGMSLGSSLMYGGFGSLGYSLLGGKLGLPQNKYSGITSGLGGALGAWGASAALSGTALGATLGSAVPIIGTAIGAVAGGALSSLLGGKKPKRPAVWGGLELDLGDAEAYREGSYDFGAAFDSKGYGRPEFEVSEGGYYAIASRDREKAGAEASQAMNAYLKEVADSAVAQARELQKALPDEYAKQFSAGLSEHVVKASYDLKGKDINEDKLKEIAADLQAQVADAMLSAFQGMDFSEYTGKISVDQSSVEGLTKFTQALAVVDETLTATKELQEPTSEWVTQARAAVAQMDAWEESMKSTGVTADYAASLMEDYRTAYVDSFVKSLDEMLNPLSELERQTKTTVDSLNGYEEALKLLGGTADDLAKVEQARAKVQADLLTQTQSYITQTPQVVTETLEMVKSLNALYEAMTLAGNAAGDFAVIDEARAKVLDGLMDKARAYVETVPAVTSEVDALNAEFAALREAMLLAGNSAEDLAELQRMQAEAVAQLQAQYAEAFRQTYTQRYAALQGDDDAGARLQQDASHRAELAEIEKTWGADSEQYRQMVALQEAEAAKLRLEQARAAKEALDAQLEQQRAELARLEQQAVQIQMDEIRKLQDVSKERISSLEKELSAAQKLHDTWEDVFATVYAKRVDLHQGSANLDVFGRLDTAQGEFDRLYSLAVGGDADAAKEMAGVAGELLSLRGETTANRAAYLDAFYDVDKKLKEVCAVGDSQVSDAQKQIDALQAQLEAENAQYSILVSQLAAQQAALSALSGQNQTLAAIQSQIANLKTQINITVQGQKTSSTVVDNAQKDYEHAKDQVEETKPKPPVNPYTGVYGSKYPSEHALLVAKADAMNAQGAENNIHPGKPWSYLDVMSAIYRNSMTTRLWYERYGKAEGFKDGGITPSMKPFWVGENGPELMMSPQQYGVLSNPQSRRALTLPAMGTGDDVPAENRKLGETVTMLLREVRILNARLEKMEAYIKETNDNVDRIRVEGIPVAVERETVSV